MKYFQYESTVLQVIVFAVVANMLSFSNVNGTIKRKFTDAQAVKRAEIIGGYQKQFTQAYQKHEDEIHQLCRVDMKIENELMVLGESTTITIIAHSKRIPNRKALVTRNHLSKNPEMKELQLDWKKTEKEKYRAVWSYTPKETGNYLFNWTCDVGGDIPEFWRNFSVIDNQWTVQIINTNANGWHPPEKYLHRYHLPSNLFCGMNLWQIPTSADQILRTSRDARQYGDDFMISLWLSNTYCDQFDVEDTKLYEEHPEVQQAVFEAYYACLQQMHFPRKKQECIMVSSMSNEIAQSLKKAGFRIFGGLYADQNWADFGDYKINHWGMPARPFFMSNEDFRKCQKESDGMFVGIQQCHRHSVLCRNYNCVFSLESGADYMMDRYAGYHVPRTITDVTQSREYDFLRSIWDTKTIRKNPLFFTCCLEFAGFDWMPEMYQLQPLMVEYIAKEVGKNKLAIATPHAVADFYRRHYVYNPESVIYLPDFWAGREQTGNYSIKPPIYPDTMEIENAIFRAIFRKGETLPYAYYDYRTSWDYPFWDGENYPRKKSGYPLEDTEERFSVKPPILDTRTMRAITKIIDTEDESLIKVSLDSKVSQKDLALAIWDIPRHFSEDTSCYSVQGAKRFVPVSAPFTHNLCGIIVMDIEKGLNEAVIKVTSKKRDLKRIDLQLNEAVFSKVFKRDGTMTAYVYNVTDQPASVTIRVPWDKYATLYHHATETDAPTIMRNTVHFTVKPKKPMRIVGLTAEELQWMTPGAQYVDITVDTPYCQIKECDL